MMNKYFVTFFGLGCIAIIIGIPIFTGYSVAKNPPRWYLQKHQTSRDLQQQSEPLAQIVVSGDELNGVYIPPNLEVETGGDGVLIKGPTKDVYRFHRKLYRLDTPRTGPLGLFPWRTK